MNTAFSKALRKIEEEHYLEISRLRQELLRELASREELPTRGCQSNSAEVGGADQCNREVGMGVARQVVLNQGEILTDCGEVGQEVAQECHEVGDSSFANSAGTLKDGSPETGDQPGTTSSSPESTRRAEVNSILHEHVSQHLNKKKSKVYTVIDKFALARGWEEIAAVEEREASLISRVVEHQGFDAVCALAIILNTALIGAVTNWRAETLRADLDIPIQYNVANEAFSVWFLTELVMRWCAEGLLQFITNSPNLPWNVFDIFVVGTDIAEHVIIWAADEEGRTIGNLTVMRMLRVLRISRALRVVRLMSFCKELRLMVLSIMRSGMSLLWSMVLLTMIIYVFCIFLMHSVLDHLTVRLSDMERLGHHHEFPKDSTDWKLEKYFGSLSMSLYMLFQAVSGGISWGEIGDLLKEVSWINGVVFCFYVFFTIFAMLNIITGIFVETAMRSAQSDSDEVVREEMKSESSLIKQLHAIFDTADKEKHGFIDEAHFETLVQDKHTCALLSGLGLQVSEARGLFHFLDLDNAGWVSMDDFLVGCMRLRGGAKEVDLVSLMYENRRLMDSWEKMARFLKSEFFRMDQFEDRVDDCLKLLRQGTQHIESKIFENEVLERQGLESSATESAI